MTGLSQPTVRQGSDKVTLGDFCSVFVLSLQFGDNSGLHLIIFDEFDAVCKSRYMYNVSTSIFSTISICYRWLLLFLRTEKTEPC